MGLIQMMEAALQQWVLQNLIVMEWLFSRPTILALEQTLFQGKNAVDTVMPAQPAQELEMQIMQSIQAIHLQSLLNLQTLLDFIVQRFFLSWSMRI